MKTKQKDSTIEDIADAINNLATNVDKRFDAVDARFDAVDKRFDSIDSKVNSQEKQQIITNQRLDNIEGKLTAIEADVKELYSMFNDLKKDIHKRIITDKNLEKRLEKIEAFAQIVANKTGIPFPV